MKRLLLALALSLALNALPGFSWAQETTTPDPTNHTVRRSESFSFLPLPPIAPDDLNQCFGFEDLDYPDYPAHTTVAPGTQFTKHLRIINQCKMSTAGMKAVRTAGDVGGPDEIPLPDISPEGQAVLSIPLTAPRDREPGIYSVVYTVYTVDNRWSNGFWTDVGVR